MNEKCVQQNVEEACRAWYDAGIEPTQCFRLVCWDKLVELGDGRLADWRAQIQAALDAVGFFELVDHHRNLVLAIRNAAEAIRFDDGLHGPYWDQCTKQWLRVLEEFADTIDTLTGSNSIL